VKPRRSTIVLGALLAISLAGNGWQFVSAVGAGLNRFYGSMGHETEIDALRSFGERVAAGERPRAVFLDLAGPVTEQDGWLDNSLLRAKFEGERLVKMCGSRSLVPAGCSGDEK